MTNLIFSGVSLPDFYLADLKSGSDTPENIKLVTLQDLDIIKQKTPADSVVIFEGKEAEKWLKLFSKSYI